ncbi:MAG TPA: hypothetical protein VLB46_18580 [Pyrinomonadaceae bacterium]|nr:hypothetical protein [Pyrinomonadaceae bacterium]
MRGLTAKEILGLWEVGQQQMPAERALTLLSTFCPQTPREDLERLSIGRRDALLLSFRELLFGSQFSGMTRCPHCRSTLEIGFSCADVRTTDAGEQAETLPVNIGEYSFKCRLPNSKDLLAVMDHRSIDSISKALFERCVTEKRYRDAEVSFADLPEEVSEAVAAEIAKHDPQADIRFDLICPDCSHQWEAIFDVVSFAWNELCSWATRLIRQVHTLALAYGWRELDILSMNPLRRQIYLEMLGE